MDSPSLHSSNHDKNNSYVDSQTSGFQAALPRSDKQTPLPQKTLKLRVSGSQRVVCLTQWGFGAAGTNDK
jgi:hypothetical protein